MDIATTSFVDVPQQDAPGIRQRGNDTCEFLKTGYVLDSSGYGLAAFRVAGALAPSSRFQQRDEGVPRRPGGDRPTELLP